MTLGWPLQALVDDDVTTAQSEFWELGDGACAENGLRPRKKKKKECTLNLKVNIISSEKGNCTNCKV